jgi:hypothetical protein
MTNFPIHPKHPERICWGCDKYCPADDLRCGNGTIRTEHPVELFGEDWFDWLMEKEQTGDGRIGGPRGSFSTHSAYGAKSPSIWAPSSRSPSGI